jgi:hypothetical protein
MTKKHKNVSTKNSVLMQGEQKTSKNSAKNPLLMKDEQKLPVNEQ